MPIHLKIYTQIKIVLYLIENIENLNFKIFALALKEMKNLGTNIMQTMQDFYDKNCLKTAEGRKNT